MRIDTLLRKAEHKALRTITISGSVLDLGGDARSDYRLLFQGEPSYTTLNLDLKAQPDILHDLEKPLPVQDSSYDHVLLINVLEHVFEYRQLIREAVRAVRRNGKVLIVVPFLFPEHPSPQDYWRFSKEALKRECELAGLKSEPVQSLGSGVFAARYVLLDRLLPTPLRMLGSIFVGPVVLILDALWTKLARALKKKYAPSDYALGYVVVAEKI